MGSEVTTMKPRVLLIVGAVVLVMGGLFVWAAATPMPANSEKPHHWPFDELHDTFEWPISHLFHLSIPLPNWHVSGAGGGHDGHANKSLHATYDPIIYFRGISKYMLLEVIAAVLIYLIYSRLARRIQSGAPPSGPWDNFFEGILTFIRDEIARPNLGEHDADRYTPFLWTLFLFILFNNLLGMLPLMGSPTANLYVTGALALCAFVLMHRAAIAKVGAGHYFGSLWPHMDVPFGMGYILKPMIFVIELLGTVIKSGVLAVRLFANMFAGHTVLAMILAFVVTAVGATAMMWSLITGASVLGVVALSLLELFVAFLQSYIFVFLTALFMGMALHPQH